MNEKTTQMVPQGAGALAGGLATELPALVERCRKIREQLLAQGYVGIYDMTLAEELGVGYEVLYNEAVEEQCGYVRYTAPGGDVLIFVDPDELVELLIKKREVKILW
jgi:hypothetical protein